MRPINAWAQDLATPVADPGSAGEIGRPETVPIEHLVVIFSRIAPSTISMGSFRGQMGSFRRRRASSQTNANGVPYVTLPPIVNSWANPPAVDTRFPSDLPNEPFLIEDYVPLADIDPSPTHRFYQHQLQVNGGRMDRYVVWSDTAASAGSRRYGEAALYPYAREHTLCDNFFTMPGVHAQSHLADCRDYTVWPGAPANQVAQPLFDSGGALIGLQHDGNVTPTATASTTCSPFYAPYQATPVEERMPPARRDHRRSPLRRKSLLGLVCGRLGRRRRRQPGADVRVPPPTVQLLLALWRRHAGRLHPGRRAF